MPAGAVGEEAREESVLIVGEGDGGMDEVEKGRGEVGDGDACFLEGTKEGVCAEVGKGGGAAKGEHGG